MGSPPRTCRTTGVGGERSKPWEPRRAPRRGSWALPDWDRTTGFTIRAYNKGGLLSRTQRHPLAVSEIVGDFWRCELKGQYNSEPSENALAVGGGPRFLLPSAKGCSILVLRF